MLEVLAMTLVILIFAPILIFFPLMYICTPLILLGLGKEAASHALRSAPSEAYVSLRSFRCPFRKTDVVVEFIGKDDAGHYLDVKSCSAFKDKHRITCKKRCLALPEPFPI